MKTRWLTVFAILVSVTLLPPLFRIDSTPAMAQGSGTTERVSIATNATQGNNISDTPRISSDGRYVVFESFASNLVSGDTNGSDDIFVHDRQTGQTSRVSVATDGTQGNGSVDRPAISANGRYVVFRSRASNLVSGDTNGSDDIFVHDRQTGQTSRVSVATDGTQGNGSVDDPAISANGRYVVFESGSSTLVRGDTNGSVDIFVHDRQTGQTSRVSVATDGTQGNGGSYWSTISGDGRYVAFVSDASNLVSGDTNGTRDIFVHDRQTGQTSRVSVATDGTQGNGLSFRTSISGDGRYVAFESDASNLVSGDTNGFGDIFVHDRQTGQTSRASVATDGTQGNGLSDRPAISANGRYVAFESDASNLVSGDTNGFGDVLVHDRQTGQTSRASVATDGTQGNGGSYWSTISCDGRYVAFASGASNLASGDTNGFGDVFVHDRGSGDCDGDGLLDDWEASGATIDPDGAGSITPQFINLPAMGADPNKPDIFLQIDWMADSSHHHRLRPEAIRRVVEAFASSPYTSPTGSVGINLHVDQGSESILNFTTGATWGTLSRARALTHVNNLGTSGTNGYNWGDFQTIKNAPGGFTQSGRTPIFHYVISAHNYGKTTSSGISRGIGASDFIISLGSFAGGVGTIGEQAGTLMHELGHNLDLCHGGPKDLALPQGQCDVNFKPNYLSVMNYAFQLDGVIKDGVGGTFDYSRVALPTLNEGNLNENTSLGSSAAGYGTRHFCSFLFGLAGNIWVPAIKADDPIDWNCDNDRNDINVNYNINGESSSNQNLIGYEDWSHIKLIGGAIGQAGVVPDLPMETEEDLLTVEVAERILPLRMVYLPLITRTSP